MKKVTLFFVALFAIVACQTAVAQTTVSEMTFDFSSQYALRSELGLTDITWGDNALPDTVTNVNDTNIFLLPIQATVQCQQAGARKSYALHMISGGSFAIEAVSGKKIVEIDLIGVTTYLTLTVDNGAYDEENTTWTGDAQKVTFATADGAYGKISKITVHYTDGTSEQTSVEEINAVNSNDGAIYNLNGQLVDENYKGIVIKGGKKYLNR